MSIEQQALSDKHKEAVKSWAPKVRKVLENDLATQLRRLGILSTGKIKPVDQMHLPENALALRVRVEALFKRDTISEGDAKRGYHAILMEISYTFLPTLRTYPTTLANQKPAWD